MTGKFGPKERVNDTDGQRLLSELLELAADQQAKINPLKPRPLDGSASMALAIMSDHTLSPMEKLGALQEDRSGLSIWGDSYFVALVCAAALARLDPRLRREDGFVKGVRHALKRAAEMAEGGEDPKADIHVQDNYAKLCRIMQDLRDVLPPQEFEMWARRIPDLRAS